MMSYRYDKKKKMQRRWYLIIGLLSVVILFTPVYSWVFGVVESPVTQTLENKQAFLDQSQNFFQSFSTKKKILAENVRLEKENKRLRVDNMRTQYLAGELEKVYEFIKNDISIIPAQVLHKGTFTKRDTMLLGKGEASGITVGDHVIGFNNTLLGVISEVYGDSSRVQLYSQNQQRVEGILFPHDVQLQARGNGAGIFIIETPREIDVQAGDILYGVEEPGYIIGVVRDIVFDPRDPFKKVYISYPDNLNKVHSVGIKKARLPQGE